MTNLSTRIGGLFAALIAAATMSATAAQAGPFGAGLIVLEGSDAQTYHGLQPYSTNFQTGLQLYSSAPTLKVLQTGYQSTGSAPAGTDFVSSLVGVDLTQYSGLYIGSPGSCCSENDAAVADASVQAAILAFHDLGRSIAIENYQGGSAFSFLLGFSMSTPDIIGYGTTSGESCFDGNQITAAGTVFGLGSGQLPSIGCFGHQAYSSAFMVAHGFGYNLADNPTYPGYTVVASNGGGGIIETLPGGVPEPATWALMISGFGMVGMGLRRRRLQATAA
jgi:hypothetical protein